jgi:hypothetical protein
MNKKQLLPFSWIEIAITFCVLLIIARFYWAKEFYEFEQSFFISRDWNENYKYLFTVPVAFLFYLSIFQREKEKANANGKPVVSKFVLLFAATSIITVILYLAI